MVLGDSKHRAARDAATAGDAAPAVERLRFPALGTQCEVQFLPPDEKTGRAFALEAVNWVGAFEAKFSRFRPDSTVSRINAAAGRDWVAIDPEVERMLALADQIHVLSRGIIDPTALPLLRLWNYKQSNPRLPTQDEVRAAAAKVGWPRVRREPGRVYLPEAGMGLDLGGFGKEYAVDRVLEMGRARGIADLLVDFGHDVRVAGRPPDAPCWSIGIEDPMRPGAIRGRLVLNEGGVATSGNYLRYFESGGRRYGHIIDPRSGHPADGECLSVTVVAPTCLEAGLLATTVFVLGPAEGLAMLEEYFGAEGSILCADRELQTRGYYRHAI